jgi:hypothetical protein
MNSYCHKLKYCDEVFYLAIKISDRQNYTRNEWRRCKTTLETSGEDVKLHSKRVEKMQS